MGQDVSVNGPWWPNTYRKKYPIYLHLFFPDTSRIRIQDISNEYRYRIRIQVSDTLWVEVSVFHSLQPTKEGATKRSPPCAKALSGGVPLRHGPYTPPVSPWVGGQGSCALVQGCCRSRRKMESREDRERAASCRV
jgi:hypothetical protein